MLRRSSEQAVGLIELGVGVDEAREGPQGMLSCP